MFLSFPLWLSGNIFSPVMYGSENSQLEFQRVVRVEEQVLVCVSRFRLDSNVETSYLLKVYRTVQERQPVLFHIPPCELGSICWVLILTQVSSTYLNRWLSVLPLKELSALLSTSTM